MVVVVVVDCPVVVGFPVVVAFLLVVAPLVVEADPSPTRAAHMQMMVMVVQHVIVISCVVTW